MKGSITNTPMMEEHINLVSSPEISGGHPLSMPGLTAPELLESLVTAATGTVEFVTDRVLLVIVLVIILGRVELCGLYNFGDDRPFKRLVFFQLGLRLQRQPLLLLIMIKDGASILIT